MAHGTSAAGGVPSGDPLTPGQRHGSGERDGARSCGDRAGVRLRPAGRHKVVRRRRSSWARSGSCSETLASARSTRSRPPSIRATRIRCRGRCRRERLRRHLVDLLVGDGDRHREVRPAVITLIRGLEIPGRGRVTVALAGLGIFGASLFFGYSMITPAISVLALSGRVSPCTASSFAASQRPVGRGRDGPRSSPEVSARPQRRGPNVVRSAPRGGG
jgi:hypothetical protein